MKNDYLQSSKQWIRVTIRRLLHVRKVMQCPTVPLTAANAGLFVSEVEINLKECERRISLHDLSILSQ